VADGQSDAAVLVVANSRSLNKLPISVIANNGMRPALQRLSSCLILIAPAESE
jgi:hypothetical protein